MALGTRSELFARALRLIPGGVNSPVRAWRAVGELDPFLVRGEGAYPEDVDGNRYIDWVMSWGALVFGHADPETVAAVQEAARTAQLRRADRARGRSRRRDRRRGPVGRDGAARVFGHGGGDERDPSRARLPRRDRIIKFDGGYHGHADALLAAAGLGLATLGIPASAGVTSGATRDTIVVPLQRRRRDRRSGRTARRGPGRDRRRARCRQCRRRSTGARLPAGAARAVRCVGALLVFDEVITGFRVARGGAQERFAVSPT